MSKDLVITKLNESYIKVECASPDIEMDLAERFKFQNANVKFDPRVKRGLWDGFIRLYNRTHKRIYTGLLLEVLKFAKSRGYSVSVDPKLKPSSEITIEYIKEFVEEFVKPHREGKPLTPYDYQYDSVHYALNMNRSISLAATSAGKSLILYLLVRFYQMLEEMEGKTIFIVVPNVSLVEQLYADFEDYSNFEGAQWRPLTFVQKVSGKYGKYINKPIVITTWQSLKNIPGSQIVDAGAILVDEVHTIKGPVLASLLESAVNCDVRHGFTGTLDDMEANILSAEGLMGPAKVIVTAKENIEAGRATPVDINVLILDYDAQTKRDYNADQLNVAQEQASIKYNSEIYFIYNLRCRRDFVLNLAKSCKGNTLVLFNRTESFGVQLYEECKAVHPNTFLIIGEVDATEREKIRVSLEEYEDAIVFATDKLMSTGVSIKNIHNGILASSTKAKIQLLQTLGRFMRLHSSKKRANIFDLVDKLDYNGRPNFVMKHVEERLKHYSKEGHKIIFRTLRLSEYPETNTLEDL